MAVVSEKALKFGKNILFLHPISSLMIKENREKLEGKHLSSMSVAVFFLLVLFL